MGKTWRRDKEEGHYTRVPAHSPRPVASDMDVPSLDEATARKLFADKYGGMCENDGCSVNGIVIVNSIWPGQCARCGKRIFDPKAVR